MQARLAIAFLGIVLAGCGELDDGLHDAPPGAPVAFEVWNRTRDAISLTDQAGRRMDVPACMSRAAPLFQLDRVTVRSSRGYWYTFGSAAPPGDPPRPQYLVLVAASETLPSPTYDRPVDLPACEGLPDVQTGS